MICIGADGGGTVTRLAAFENGVRIAEADAGPLNYRNISPAEAARHLAEGLAALGIPAARITAMGIADPSLDDAAETDDVAAGRFYAILSERLSFPVYARSDAFITLTGLKRDGPAVLVIAGTGSMGIARNAAGEIRTAGGWGRLTGDEGSGYTIAVRAIRSALRAADGLGGPTALTGALLGYFGVTSPRRLIPVLYGDPKPDIAAFSREVARCADRGDETAAAILRDAADGLAEIAAHLVRWSGSRTVGIWGSVLIRNERVRGRFEGTLRKLAGDVYIAVPPLSAEEAAADYAATLSEKTSTAKE
ncbi:MAG: hypothetical protein K6A33_12145 [Clostridiales bacterium]|nr:hypothetical protein [Clostridiales bacterium]